MAEAGEDSQRTEEPTQRRIDEARQKGQVASSREVNHWFMILAATVVVTVFAPAMLADIGRVLTPFLAATETIPTGASDLRAVVIATTLDLVRACLAPLGVLVAAALAAGVLQHGLLASTEHIRPQLNRVSPLAGAKRLFSLRTTTEFIKGLAKVAIVGAVATMLLWPAMGDLANLATVEAAQLLDHIKVLAVRVLVGVLAVMTLIAILDFLYQKFELLKKLRMSRQELKDEFRQSEGDPIVKGRLRRIRMERARRRMMAAVPEADVVITNPTHYAVALKYDPATMSAPRVTAKGVDHLARRIRELAEEHRVPVVENPPLARGLHAAVEIDAEVPAEHYRAVAQVIGYVMRLKGRGRAGSRPN